MEVGKAKLEPAAVHMVLTKAALVLMVLLLLSTTTRSTPTRLAVRAAPIAAPLPLAISESGTARTHVGGPLATPVARPEASSTTTSSTRARTSTRPPAASMVGMSAREISCEPPIG